ncbi:alpha/beta fold hydrolase [Terrabacter sp. MAHUQ-38]|uniref:alpha/beta fold hydrolase n=1 Tax=unclassified Terrabacter TaxID=2630222 RepID=UPI00165DCF32|nr:alpha/beta fold hydrolase [Terrabacter sp. MAHUQ-38]
MAGVTLHERRWGARGARRAVVLVHATGETSADWAEVAEALAADRLVVAVDLRGHGASPWPGAYALPDLAQDLTVTVERLHDESRSDGGHRAVDVVAHSLGGLVACLVASGRPDLVRRLVLEDVPVPHPREPRPPVRPSGELAFDWEAVLQVRAQIDAPDRRWPEVVAAVTAPALVVWGGPSSPMPPAHVAEMATTVADGRLVRIDAGHLVHATEPEAFTRTVRDFLDSPA